MGNTSRDMTLFKDDDGSGYLISEDVCIICPCYDEKYPLRVDQIRDISGQKDCISTN